MNINTPIRIILGLCILPAIALLAWASWAYTGDLSFTHLSGNALFVLVTLIFLGMVFYNVLRNKKIPKIVLVVSVIFALISATVTICYGYGFLQDALGVECQGFFGSTASCTLGTSIAFGQFIMNDRGVMALALLSGIGIFGLLWRDYKGTITKRNT